jgi:hypothetical protein
VENTVTLREERATAVPAPPRSVPPADAFVRRLLRVPAGGRTASAASARSAFGTSLLVSTVRCLLTYIVLPVLGPVLGITGTVGPVVGFAVGAVSVVAIVISMRRFWAADHKMRWHYTALGTLILVLLAFQAVGDVRNLLT